MKRLALVVPFLALALLVFGESRETRPSVRPGSVGGSRSAAAVRPESGRGNRAAPTTRPESGGDRAAPTVRPERGVAREARDDESKGDVLESARRGLASDSVTEQRAALEAARELLAPSLVPDVERLVARSDDRIVKEIGAQVLALGAPERSVELLEKLFDDEDAVTRINAAFGLARAGDQSKQEWLLAAYDGSRAEAPLLMPLLGEMLERPEIKSQAVIERYELVLRDETLDREVRERAAEIVRKKRAP